MFIFHISFHGSLTQVIALDNEIPGDCDSVEKTNEISRLILNKSL